MGNKSSVNSHVENASRTGVFQLSKMGLSEFPKQDVVSQLKNNVRSIDLSHNKIKFIPESIGTFIQLKQLNMNFNKLSSLPDEIGLCRKLETITMTNNLIVTVPSSFADLINLRVVDLSENQIRMFPVQLAQLKQLDVVHLSRNKIQEIPDGLQTLHASEINLNQNQVSKVSESIASCPRLKVLRLEENCLTIHSIPSTVLSDSQISLLAVDGNMFSSKEFQDLPGYDKYLERFTATKKKLT